MSQYAMQYIVSVKPAYCFLGMNMPYAQGHSFKRFSRDIVQCVRYLGNIIEMGNTGPGD